jgi:carboxymethylenebutenolidase
MILEQTTVELATPTGPMRTYVYAPVDKRPRPGVVFYSEIFQRTGPMGRIAAFLAGQGLVVAVPEIFHELEPAGTVLGYDQADTGNRHKLTKPVAAHDADARAVLDHLTGRADCSGALHTMGVCIGGHLAFRCAFDARIRSAACFYATDLHQASLGGGDDSLVRAGDIGGELLLVWGRSDPHIPEAGRDLIHARLRHAGRRFTWHEVEAAHAFLRDEGPRYDPALALWSYRMVLDLIARTS